MQEAKQYLRKLRTHIPVQRKRKQEFLNRIHEDVYAYAIEHPAAKYNDYCDRLESLKKSPFPLSVKCLILNYIVSSIVVSNCLSLR